MYVTVSSPAPLPLDGLQAIFKKIEKKQTQGLCFPENLNGDAYFAGEEVVHKAGFLLMEILQHIFLHL
jgi:hypothetical protein